ncbi:hypothetical protein OXPF_14490 [Oxobacter pfennigii]|uniref:Uncharacterized protein n=1 Tax=Oxobacter pfennigii TaxID=36849 RepID=A0A0P8YCS3_9CLOT|nr:hypothetical protein [Oxobacter pfennigii]KPU44971.1 hypothetical protein OXPF_14490 [Oxobacter pfennigii]
MGLMNLIDDFLNNNDETHAVSMSGSVTLYDVNENVVPITSTIPL